MTEPETTSGMATDPASSGLGQIERVVDAYVAPTKTFADIRRSASWWLPFLLTVVVGYIFTFAIQHEVGFEKLAETTLQNNAQVQQRTSSMTPEQVQQMNASVATSYKVALYASPALVLLFAMIAAGVLMMSFNLGLGAQTPFSHYFAVWMYATLPTLIKSLLASITLFAGLGADQFQMENPVGTNIGFYLGQDAPKWLSTLLTSADIFTLWSVFLLVIGCAIVAKVKRGQAAMVVVGWWVLIVLGSAAMAAIRG
jgi:hypothetical protein